MKRIINQDEERTYRLVSGEFQGLTVEEAAELMEVTPRRVQQLLASVKEKAPQLFPLLTKREAVIHRRLLTGDTDDEIMEALEVDENTFNNTIKALREKGRLPSADAVKVLRYSEHMAENIKEKF